MRKNPFCRRGILLAGVTSLTAASAADKLKVGFIYLGPVGDFAGPISTKLDARRSSRSSATRSRRPISRTSAKGRTPNVPIEQLVRAGNKLIFTTSFG